MFAAYASTRGRTLVDRHLYLLKSWTSDRERCRAAGVPDGPGFATKTELARVLVTRASSSFATWSRGPDSATSSQFCPVNLFHPEFSQVRRV